jgi:hypothetical protein
MLSAIAGDIAVVVGELLPLLAVVVFAGIMGEVSARRESERARRAERREIVARFRKSKGEG